MVTSSTKFARYSGMRFVKHFKVSLSFYLLGEHAHLKTLSFKISNILPSILNFSFDTFDSLVQVSYAQDKSACVSFNFRTSHRRLTYTLFTFQERKSMTSTQLRTWLPEKRMHRFIVNLALVMGKRCVLKKNSEANRKATTAHDLLLPHLNQQWRQCLLTLQI